MAEQFILEGDPPIAVDLRRSPRARRLTLRVAARDGRVTLTVPSAVRAREAMDFAQSKQGWIETQLGKVAPETPIEIGGKVPIEGQTFEIALAPIRAPRLEGGALLLPKRSAARPGRAIAAFLKLLARERLAVASDFYAAELGTAYNKLTLRDPRTRWGSCSARGALMYSWRLAMAPPAVLRYVAAHEVAHLREMNHSPAFWAVVGQLMPDYQHHRAWLRREGTRLQRIVLD